MFAKTSSYLNVLWQLLKSDFTVFRQFFIGKLINRLIWYGFILAIFTYIFPMLGMIKGFGPFMAFSLLAGEGFWRMWSFSFEMVADLEGNRVIDYYLTLPLPSWLIFLKITLFQTFQAIIFLIFLLPITKLIIWNITLASFSIPNFAIIFIITNLFYGLFFIFLTSFCKNMQEVENIGFRVLFPMWFCGASNFPWDIIQKSLSPYLSYIFLVNPLLYVMEGVHAAALGQGDYLNFWVCTGVLTLLTVIFGILGIVQFKKRLDFV